MTRKVGMLTAIFMAAVLFTLVIFTGATSGSAQRVLSNVYAGDVSLGEMTREQGVSRLQEIEGELKEGSITLRCGDLLQELALGSVDVDVDYEAVMDQALEAGHLGPVWQRWSESRRIRSEGAYIPLAVTVNQEKLKKEADRLFAEVISPPQDAGFYITPGDQVEIIPGINGRGINHEALYDSLQEMLVSGTGLYDLQVTQVEIPPSRTTQDVEAMGINGLLSAYTTQFNPSQEGRSYNIKVAATALDDVLVAPGQELSFNQVVGPRSTEAGYKSAKIIVDNEFVDGTGGGVCQVSSTLYNAVLLADLEIAERSNHSLPVTYVPIGRDATVVYGYQDFRFRNNSDHYVLVKSVTGYNTLTFKIFGDTGNKPHVTIKSWVTEEIAQNEVLENDPELAKGEQVVKQAGSYGYKTSGEIIVARKGKTSTKSLLGSYYRPVNKIVAVGTKETGLEAELPENGLPENEPPADKGPKKIPGENGNGNSAGPPAADESNQNQSQDHHGQDHHQVEIILPGE